MKNFKNILLLAVFAFVAIFLSACSKSEFVTDGVFTAFSHELHNDGPQITTVSVTIEKGKIKEYYIDCLQNTATDTGFAFNEKTKKELGYLYGMHIPASGVTFPELYTEEGLAKYEAYLRENDKLEWFEQAELIEAALLEKGVEEVLVEPGTNLEDVIASVTIVDGNYTSLAQEAVELAKAGKTHVLKTTDNNEIVWVTAEVNKKGKFTSLQINTLQGAVVDGKWVWNEENKQQLQYRYGMHVFTAGLSFAELNTEEGMKEYKNFLAEEGLLEWFEQVDMLTEYALKHGLDTIELDDKVLDSDAPDAIASITINVNHYYDVLTKVFELFPQ